MEHPVSTRPQTECLISCLAPPYIPLFNKPWDEKCEPPLPDSLSVVDWINLVQPKVALNLQRSICLYLLSVGKGECQHCLSSMAN